jgi:uncharacterized membrane protein
MSGPGKFSTKLMRWGIDAAEDKNPRLVLVAIVLVALVLRLTQLTLQPLWWDEGWSLYFVTTDVPTMLKLTAVDIHPPFYYLLLHLWIKLFGSSVFSVRLLSAAIGTVTVPLLYAAARRLLGAKGALLAAFLLAISPFHIYYSQEVRMYGLVTLLGLATFYFALHWKPRKWEPGNWVGYVLTAAAALHTQYYVAFLLLALNLVVLIRWLKLRAPGKKDAQSIQLDPASPTSRQPASPALGKRGKLLPWLSAQLAVALLFLPWLWYAGDKLLTYVRFKVGVEKDPSFGLFAYVGRHLAAFNWGHAEGVLIDWWWIGLLPLAILLASLGFVFWQRARTRDRENWQARNWDWPLALFIVTLTCGFVVNLILPFNPPRSERLLLLALPAYLLLIAHGLLYLWRCRCTLAIVSGVTFVIATIVSLSLFYTVPRYPDDDYRPLIERVRALSLHGDAIVAIHPWQVGYFQAYIPNDAVRPVLFLTPREVLPRERQLWADDPARMAADLDTLLAEHDRLWFPDHRSMGRVLERRVEAYLAGHAYPVFSEWYGENTVLSFFATGTPVAASAGPGPVAQFGEWLSLEDIALSSGPLAAGQDIVAVNLTWQSSAQPTTGYVASLHLLGPTGHVWAQRDAPLFGGLEEIPDGEILESHLDRHGLLVPAGTPPGEYAITLRIYHSEDVKALPVTFEGDYGDEVVLDTVRVVRPEMPPPVEALPIEQSLQVDFGDRLRLLGFSAHNDSALLPGEEVEIDLFWQALVDPGEDLLPQLQLLDSRGTSLTESTAKPVAGTYPTAWWKSGELVHDPHVLPIPATVPPGRYRLALGLVGATDGASLEIERGQTTVALAEIEVTSREHRFEPLSPEHVQVTQFGTSVELIGYDLNDAVRAPGSTLEVTLHWRTLETPDKNYHTFVHLLDDGGDIVTQHDSPPGDGAFPTLGWLPGEYVLDPHWLQIPATLPDGEYYLGVGLYDPDTDVRLGDRDILNTPIVVSSGQ